MDWNLQTPARAACLSCPSKSQRPTPWGKTKTWRLACVRKNLFLFFINFALAALFVAVVEMVRAPAHDEQSKAQVQFQIEQRGAGLAQG